MIRWKGRKKDRETICQKGVVYAESKYYTTKGQDSRYRLLLRARTKPIMQDVVCYQELEPPYEYYVMEKVDFFEAYTRSFEELPRKRQKYLEKKQDLPDKQPRISKGEVLTRTEEEEVEPVDEKMRKMIAFFDAPTYRQKLKILEEMKNDLDEHMINNMAVSLDLSIEEGMDGYKMILSELKIRSKYETSRGDRL